MTIALQGNAQGGIIQANGVPAANAAAFAGAASQSKSHSDASSNSGGNTQSVTVADSGQMQYSGKYEVKNVPSVFSGNVYPTTNCAHSTQVGSRRLRLLVKPL